MPANENERRERLKAISEVYFAGLAQKDMSAVPWAEDVVVRSPLAPEGLETPMVGAPAVHEWFESLFPVLGEIRVIEHYYNEDLTAVATRSDVGITDPQCTLRVVDRFHVNNEGKITEQENHYDPRQAIPASD